MVPVISEQLLIHLKLHMQVLSVLYSMSSKNNELRNNRLLVCKICTTNDCCYYFNSFYKFSSNQTCINRLQHLLARRIIHRCRIFVKYNSKTKPVPLKKCLTVVNTTYEWEAFIECLFGY